MIIPNEVVPDFKLNGKSISEFTFENSIVCLGTDAILVIDLDIDASEPQINQELGMRLSRLVLTLTCCITAPAIPEAKTDVKITLEGEFASSLKTDEENFRNLLLLNGTAALYSIARGKVEAISSLAYHSGKITLPMINVVDFLKSKNKKSSETVPDPKSSY